jgi:hypothetical protein
MRLVAVDADGARGFGPRCGAIKRGLQSGCRYVARGAVAISACNDRGQHRTPVARQRRRLHNVLSNGKLLARLVYVTQRPERRGGPQSPETILQGIGHDGRKTALPFYPTASARDKPASAPRHYASLQETLTSTAAYSAAANCFQLGKQPSHERSEVLGAQPPRFDEVALQLARRRLIVPHKTLPCVARKSSSGEG